MKNTLALFLIIFAFGNIAFSKGFVIEGTISGAEGARVYLTEVAVPQKKIDSTFVKEGKFLFKGKVTEPQQWQIVVTDSKESFRLLADNEHIKISGSLPEWYKAKITGAKWQTEWEKFELKSIPFYKEMEKLDPKLMEYNEKNPVLFKLYMDSLNLIGAARLKMVEEYIRENPNSFTALYAIVYNCYNFSISKDRELLAVLNPKLQKHDLALKVMKELEIMSRIEVGKAAPTFVLKDLQGNTVDLAAYKGKYVLLDFWASWCGPCRAEVPNLKNMQAKYSDKGLIIIGITLDENEDKWQKAIKEDGSTWIHLQDLKAQKEIVENYGVRSVPSGFLIDPNGIVVGMGLRKEALSDKLAEIFGK